MTTRNVGLAIVIAIATQVVAHVIVNEYYRRTYGMI